MNSDTHFLIVDDYTNIRTLVRQQLSEFGIEKITEAEKVDDGIEVLKANMSGANKVDFVISDWNMPGKTGLEFLKWVRSQPELKNLPFLILTTENEQAKIMSAVSEGVSNFLLKPWEEDELGEKIQLCWEKHHG